MQCIVPEFTPEVGEYKYTLHIEQNLVLGDYRQTLKSFQQQSMIKRWKAQQYQGKIARSESGIFRKLGSLTVDSYVVQMLTRTIPTGRLLHHLPKFSNMKFCPFCDSYEKDSEEHFFSCPRNMYILERNPPPISKSDQRLLSCQINIVLASLDQLFSGSSISFPQHRALVRIYTNRCIMKGHIICSKTFKAMIHTLKFQPQLNSISSVSIITLAECFFCTSLCSGGNPTFWKNCRRWLVLGHNAPQILGAWTDATDIIGSSTLVDVLVDKVLFRDLTKLFVLASQTSYPTRIVFQAQENSLDFPGLVCLPKVREFNYTYVFHNQQGQNVFPINRSKFFSVFGQQPQFKCTGSYILLNPEREIRLRALLFPLGWIHTFNKIPCMGEYSLSTLSMKYSLRQPLSSSVCYNILGFTQINYTDSLFTDFVKFSPWIRRFGKEILSLRKRLWEDLT